VSFPLLHVHKYTFTYSQKLPQPPPPPSPTLQNTHAYIQTPHVLLEIISAPPPLPTLLPRVDLRELVLLRALVSVAATSPISLPNSDPSDRFEIDSLPFYTSVDVYALFMYKYTCMCVYICKYICMYIYYVCVYVYMYIYTHIACTTPKFRRTTSAKGSLPSYIQVHVCELYMCMHTRIYVCIYRCTYMYIYIYTNISMFIHTYIYMYKYIYICVHRYTYIYKYA